MKIKENFQNLAKIGGKCWELKRREFIKGKRGGSTKSTSDVDNRGRRGQREREQDVLISHVAANDETPFLSGQQTSDKSTPKTTTKRKSFVKLTKIAFNFFFSEIIFRRIHIDEQLSTSFKWMKKKLTWFSMKFKCKFESFSRQKFE